jgi:hypothetical protein
MCLEQLGSSLTLVGICGLVLTILTMIYFRLEFVYIISVIDTWLSRLKKKKDDHHGIQNKGSDIDAETDDIKQMKKRTNLLAIVLVISTLCLIVGYTMIILGLNQATILVVKPSVNSNYTINVIFQ